MTLISVRFRCSAHNIHTYTHTHVQIYIKHLPSIICTTFYSYTRCCEVVLQWNRIICNVIYIVLLFYSRSFVHNDGWSQKQNTPRKVLADQSHRQHNDILWERAFRTATGCLFLRYVFSLHFYVLRFSNTKMLNNSFTFSYRFIATIPSSRLFITIQQSFSLYMKLFLGRS